jgi:hypothetical protein
MEMVHSSQEWGARRGKHLAAQHMEVVDRCSTVNQLPIGALDL